MKKFIQSFDRFGVPVYYRVNKQEDTYKSVIGGLITITLFLASVTYAVYVFWKWEEGLMSPKISSTKQLSTINDLPFDDLLQLSFWKSQRTPIDPFKAKGNIITPYFFRQDENGDTIIESILNNDSTQLNSYEAQTIYPILIKNQVFDVYGNKMTNVDMAILFGKCNPKDMKEGQYCASKEEMDQFFNQPMPVILIDFKFRKLNPLTQQIDIIQEEYYIQVENTHCSTINYVLYSTSYLVKNDLVLDTSQYYEFVDRVTLQPETNSLQYCQRAFDREIYGQLYFAMQQEQTQQLMEFPNLGDLLANIGSIVSALFMAKYIVITINFYFLQDQIFNQVLDFYYPEFKKLVYQYNCRRKLVTVTYRNQQVDIHKFVEFRERMRTIIYHKLEFTNLLYEMSRLQFMVRSFTTRETIRKLHYVAPKLPFYSEQFIGSNKSCQLIDQESQLTSPKYKNNLLEEIDCQLFSLNQRDIQLKDDLTINDEVPLDDFFEINKYNSEK